MTPFRLSTLSFRLLGSAAAAYSTRDKRGYLPVAHVLPFTVVVATPLLRPLVVHVHCVTRLPQYELLQASRGVEDPVHCGDPICKFATSEPVPHHSPSSSHQVEAFSTDVQHIISDAKKKQFLQRVFTLVSTFSLCCYYRSNLTMRSLLILTALQT